MNPIVRAIGQMIPYLVIVALLLAKLRRSIARRGLRRRLWSRR